MRKAILLTVLIIGCAQLAHAQDSERKVEFFGGYSHLNTDLEEPDAPLDRFDNLDGFNASVTGYVTKRFGITGDFSAHFRSRTENLPGGTIRFRSRSFNYLGGPQVKFTNSTRLTPFVHALAGVANNRFAYRATATGASTPAADVSVSVTDFALALGGDSTCESASASPCVSSKSNTIRFSCATARNSTPTAVAASITCASQSA